MSKFLTSMLTSLRRSSPTFFFFVSVVVVPQLYDPPPDSSVPPLRRHVYIYASEHAVILLVNDHVVGGVKLGAKIQEV